MQVINALKKILGTPSELLGTPLASLRKKILEPPLCDFVLVCVYILQAGMPLV